MTPSLPTVRLLPLIAVSALLMMPMPAAVQAQEQAQSADSFVDSMGINPPPVFGFGINDVRDPNHEQPAGFYTAVKGKLYRLGVRHLRFTPPDQATAQDLAKLGMTSLYKADAPDAHGAYADPGTLAAIVASIKAENAPLHAIEGVEGPNEPDGFWLDSAKGQQYGFGAHGYTNAAGDAEGYRQGGISGVVLGTTNFMHDLYALLKSDPKTKALPIAGLSFGGTYDPGGGHPNPWVNSGLYADVDYGNFHPYPGGNSFSNPVPYDTIAKYFWQSNQPSVVTDEWPYAFDVYQPVYTSSTGSKRAMYVTETGWQSGTGNGEISYNVQAKYIPRLFAEFFRTDAQTRPGTGIVRTYLFSFEDDGDGDYGLLRNDLTPKPAYTALQSLITLLKERGAEFTPSTLSYSMNVSPVGDYTRTQYVHHLLLQKSTGAYYLVLWHEISDDDTSATPFREITPPALPTTVSLPSSIKSVTEYAYDANWKLVPKLLPITGGQVTLPVPDQLVVLKLS